jgi:hypothetical protein
MTQLNKRISGLDIPSRMRKLKISDEGYPIPYFVPYVNGKPDFRGMDGEKLSICIRHKRCWLCGEPLCQYMTFVIGPMCAVTHVSSEPPSHRGCAEYAATACPFLTQPRMRRNEKDLPEGEFVGMAIKRNPGVTLLWTTMEYRVFRAKGGVLFDVCNPTEVRFMAEGRKATRTEIMESINSGLPILIEMAEKEGPSAMKDLNDKINVAITLVPPEEIETQG